MPFVTTSPVNQPFGSTGNTPAASGAYFQLDNPGYSTIGANISPDGGAIVHFYGSFDGVNYDDLTLRQLGNDGYSYECSGAIPANYIGSISALRSVRFVNKTGSASPCSVVGVMSAEASTIEGIENGPAPHKFGNQLINIGFDIAAATATNSGLFTPAARHKFVVTDISFGIASATPVSITFHEGSGNVTVPNKWAFATYANLGGSEAAQISAGFNTPYVATEPAVGLFLTTSAAVTMRGAIHGYQTEA